MGYPELKSDESIILTAQHVKVKSVPFELVLTNRRLILIDSAKNIIPTQAIALATIRNVARGENAIRDPVLTLTILTDTADTREMALTFAMQTAGERKREAEEWVKALRKYSAEAAHYPAEPTAAPAPSAPEPVYRETPASPGTKKKIEIARPIKKVAVDTSHLPPKPVETSSLPEGSFCGRCGNRIPSGSTFCNRCGTKVLTEQEAAAGIAAEVPAAVPQVSVPPVAQPADHNSRPIEQIIHSIEPLIEDSVPRTQPTPEVPSHQKDTTPAPAEQAEVPPVSTVPASAEPAAPVVVPDAAAAPAPAETSTGIPADAQFPPMPPLPPVPSAPAKKRSKVLIAVIAVIVVIAVAVGGMLLLNYIPGAGTTAPAVTPTPTETTAIPTTVTTVPTTVPTTVVTTIAVPTTTQVSIPQSGVWIEIIYAQTYTGSVGTPGSQQTVSDTGDHFYQIPAKDGLVTASLEKTDGSADKLTVNVYKDGTLVTTESTTIPKGKLDVQAVLSTPTTQATATLTKVPIPTATVNSTAAANATAA
ncbi:MAG: hypothetical protein LUQ31_02865 [Methanoregula sp.]|nr:hypothetical protein [Methanoregula sp.]